MYKISPEARVKYIQFLEKYKNILPKELQEKANSGNFIDKTYFEIITFLHAISINRNPLYQFANTLKANVPNLTEKKILEYSYNYLPSLSIACQEILQNQCNIMAYSKKVTFHGNFHVKCFSEKEKKIETDIIIAFLIDSLEEILEIVQQKNIECMIQTIPNKEYTRDEYYHYLITKKGEMRQTNPELETELLFNSFSNIVDSPIFLTRKKTKENDL